MMCYLPLSTISNQDSKYEDQQRIVNIFKNKALKSLRPERTAGTDSVPGFVLKDYAIIFTAPSTQPCIPNKVEIR